MTKRKLLAVITAILTLLLIAFIFGNSLKGVIASHADSEAVTKILKPFLSLFIGEENVTEHLVRKIAHFVEFSAIGVLTALLAVLFGKPDLRHTVDCEFFLLATALIDETLQIFSDRGPMVSDIWLDFFAASLGLLFTLLIAKLSRTSSGKRK